MDKKSPAITLQDQKQNANINNSPMGTATSNPTNCLPLSGPARTMDDPETNEYHALETTRPTEATRPTSNTAHTPSTLSPPHDDKGNKIPDTPANGFANNVQMFPK